MSREDRDNIHLSGSYTARKKHRQALVEERRRKKARRRRLAVRAGAVIFGAAALFLILRFAGPPVVHAVSDLRQNIAGSVEEWKEKRAQKKAEKEAAGGAENPGAEEAAAESVDSANVLWNTAATGGETVDNAAGTETVDSTASQGDAAAEAGESSAGGAAAGGVMTAGLGSAKSSAGAEEASGSDAAGPGNTAASPGLAAPFSPHSVSGTEPENLIASTAVMVDGEVLDSPAAFRSWYNINFGEGAGYTGMPGIVTFRGNSFRDAPAFGTAEMTEHKLEKIWSVKTGSRTYKEKTWTGSGWTGQPLIVKWPRETKAVMNMYDAAKEDDELVEVIYACLDGKIYFLNLKTGEQTRDTLDIGFTFKGSGALDPRGLPLLYVGSGYNSTNGRSRAFIISLIDGSVLYTFGNSDDFADRTTSFFDSSPLVDAASDTLIYPGENGVLYLIHLNTNYDGQAGTLSVDPDRVCKWKYMGKRTGSEYWLGMEDSAAVYGGYLFIADNGADLMCLDLNTLQLKWAQDTLDDTNSSPVLSVEDGKLYLYISTSFHKGWRSSKTAAVPVWKIDAETGEIVWQHDYECHTQEGVSGGVQSTIACGKNDLSDYIYVTVSMTEDTGHGVLACLRKDTGETVWEHKASYAWSSPVCVYNNEGNGSVLYCSSSGKFYLLDGLTGNEHDMYDFDHVTVEASPAVYEDHAVIGTRDCRICGFALK